MIFLGRDYHSIFPALTDDLVLGRRRRRRHFDDDVDDRVLSLALLDNNFYRQQNKFDQTKKRVRIKKITYTVGPTA